MIRSETSYWIEIAEKFKIILNIHYRPKSCNKILYYDDVLQLLCPNACAFYRWDLYTGNV